MPGCRIGRALLSILFLVVKIAPVFSTPAFKLTRRQRFFLLTQL
jgi:hypothetical protein